MDSTMSFTVTGGKGFHLKFANGYAVSVQWGPSNYCSPQGGRFGDCLAPQKVAASGGCWQSESAEVAIFEKDGEMMTLSGDSVEGWVDAERVAALLAAVAGLLTYADAQTVRGAVFGALYPDDESLALDDDGEPSEQAASWLSLGS